MSPQHAPHRTLPHARQWCRRRTIVNLNIMICIMLFIVRVCTHFWPQIMHAGASVSGTQYGCTLPSSSCSELSPASTDTPSPGDPAAPWGAKNIYIDVDDRKNIYIAVTHEVS